MNNAASLFDQITVNISTGAIAYPKLEGFELNMEHMYSTASRFAPHCGSLEMAVKQAIHQQLAAHQGAMQLFGKR